MDQNIVTVINRYGKFLFGNNVPDFHIRSFLLLLFIIGCPAVTIATVSSIVGTRIGSCRFRYFRRVMRCVDHSILGLFPIEIGRLYDFFRGISRREDDF